QPIAQSFPQFRDHPILLASLAGLLAGLSFLMRHPGLLLLPWGVLVLLVIGGKNARRAALAFGLAFLLGSAPQLLVNTLQTGAPLYNQQAKNIWLAVYGGTDWGRWEEAPNSIGLAEVILRDPGRFLANWASNLRAYSGSGAEDTSEFGRAIQLRLLGWPANWLALAGCIGWLWQSRRLRAVDPLLPALLSLIVLYVASVATAFALLRFFLPLVAIYAVAAAWAAARLFKNGPGLAFAALVLVVVLWNGFSAGRQYVLDLQPADEIAAVRMVEALAPGDTLIAARVSARLPLAKYSAIAHRVIDWPQGGDTARPVGAAELAELRTRGAVYLLWDETAGPPPLADPVAARLAATDRYGLYQLK
ncbi:MAG: hypothetical protein HC822_18890, partial [Oscillochloris sp.]|nr:hypothetical protein [Oscillochloris sp.]